MHHDQTTFKMTYGTVLMTVSALHIGFDRREPEGLSEEVMDGLSYLAISCAHLQSTLWRGVL